MDNLPPESFFRLEKDLSSKIISSKFLQVISSTSTLTLALSSTFSLISTLTSALTFNNWHSSPHVIPSSNSFSSIFPLIKLMSLASLKRVTISSRLKVSVFIGKALDRHWHRWGGRMSSFLHLSKREVPGVG